MLEAFKRAAAARDWDAIAATLAPGFVVHDHSPLGWGTLDGPAYVESLKPLAGGATALVGLEPDWVGRAGRAGMRALFAWDGRDARRAGEDFRALNASAWELVHFLADERGRAFATFQGRLGAGAPPERAWRESLPGYDPQGGGLERLERDVGGWK